MKACRVRLGARASRPLAGVCAPLVRRAVCGRDGRAPGRAGLSLVEVLISMFVMTIGLLGLAALIPVGQAMMSRGAIEEEKAIVGRQALREFKIQGLLKPFNPADGRGNAQDPNRWVPADPAGPLGNTLFAEADAFCFDPLAIARHGRAANSFPAAPAPGAPWMQRVWLLKHSSAAPGRDPPWPLAQALAEQLCTSQDDLAYERPDDGDLRAVPLADTNRSRTFEGNFSWLVTAVREPNVGSSGLSLDRNTFTVSVVVFHRRDLSDLGVSERVGRIVPSTIAGLKRGGDAQYREYVVGGAEPLSLKPGRWLLLCSSAAKDQPRGYFRWYRVRAANPVPNLQGNWDLNLAGPSWPAPDSQEVYVVAPEGVVGVYERTMRIERPSAASGWQ